MFDQPSEEWYSQMEAGLLSRADEIYGSADRLAQPGVPKQTRLAMTVPPPSSVGGSYPTAESEPNTYWIIFVDGTFAADTQGTLTPTTTLRQTITKALTTAHCVRSGEGTYCEANSLILVSFSNGRWWFDRGGGSGGMSLRRIRLLYDYLPLDDTITGFFWGDPEETPTTFYTFNIPGVGRGVGASSSGEGMVNGSLAWVAYVWNTALEQYDWEVIAGDFATAMEAVAADSIADDAVGTCNLWWRDSSGDALVDSGHTVEALNTTGQAIISGDRLIVNWKSCDLQWTIFHVRNNTLTPFELYDNITPGQSDKYAWKLKADLTRDTTADKVLFSDGILKSTRAFGTSHAGVTDGARGWYSTGPDGKNQIVAMEPLGTWIKAQASADAASGYPVSLKSQTLLQPMGGILAAMPTTATNVFGQAVATDDWLLVFWNETTAAWGCFKAGSSSLQDIIGDDIWTEATDSSGKRKISHIHKGTAYGTATPSLKATVAPYNTTTQRITITPIAIAVDEQRHVVSMSDTTTIPIDIAPTDVIGDDVWTSAAWVGAQRKVSHIASGTAYGSATPAAVLTSSGTKITVTPKDISLDSARHVVSMNAGTAADWDMADHLTGTTWITLASALGIISITHADASTATQTGPTPTIDLSGQTVTLSFTPETFDAKGHYKANGSAVTDTITLPITDVDGSTWIDVSISTGTATVSHKTPDSTVSYAYSPASSLAVVSDGGTGYNLALTPHRLDFDSKGHEILTANTDGTAVVAALVHVTWEELNWDSTNKKLRTRTRGIWALKEDDAGSWSDVLTTTTITAVTALADSSSATTYKNRTNVRVLSTDSESSDTTLISWGTC